MLLRGMREGTGKTQSQVRTRCFQRVKGVWPPGTESRAVEPKQ